MSFNRWKFKEIMCYTRTHTHTNTHSHTMECYSVKKKATEFKCAYMDGNRLTHPERGNTDPENKYGTYLLICP